MEPESFKVTSLQSASWCMSKVSTAAGKIANAQAMRDEAINRINAWFDEYTAGHAATIAAMEEFLAPWVDKEIADQKSKSVKLPNGVAGYRSMPESVIITDEEAVIAEAKAAGIEVHIKESVHKKDLKEYMYAGGKLDNAYILPGGEKFYVTVKEGKITDESEM